VTRQLQRTGEVKYRGVWHALSVIYKEEGFYGYLKGNGTNIVRIFPYSAVQFAAYEQFKKASDHLFPDAPAPLLVFDAAADGWPS